MQEMQIVIPITPIGKPRMTRGSTKSDAAERYWQFKDSLIQWFNIAGYDLYKMDIHEIHLHAGIPMYPSWSKKKKAKLVGQPMRQKPDFDNIEKAVGDAICFNVKGKGDDSGVYKSSFMKTWTREDEGYLQIMLRYEDR